MERTYDLNDLLFVDRVFIRLTAAPDLSSIDLETEALLPDATGLFSIVAWIRVHLSTVQQANLQLKGGFHNDMALPYFGVAGDDYRGNEVYRFDAEGAPSGGRLVRLVSDLLNLEVLCDSVEVTVLQRAD